MSTSKQSLAMRCPHCDDPIDGMCTKCPTCNKDVKPVPRRVRTPSDLNQLHAALTGVTIVEDLQVDSAASLGPGRKRCPFCAEEVLQQAIVCKHCRRDIVSTGTLPFTPVPGESATSAAMYFLASLAGIVLSLFALGVFGPILVVVITSIWAGADASSHRLQHYQQSLGGPATVLFGSLLLWIVVFPLYLATRSRIRAGVQPIR